MLRLEGVLDGVKLVLVGIDEVEYETPMLDRELRNKGSVCEYFRDKKELIDWIKNYRVKISDDYIGIAVGISINGFSFLERN